jgi:hypothetical protein
MTGPETLERLIAEKHRQYFESIESQARIMLAMGFEASELTIVNDPRFPFDPQLLPNSFLDRLE